MSYPTEHLSPAERALHTDLALLGSLAYSMAAEMVMDARSPSFMRRCEQMARNVTAVRQQLHDHLIARTAEANAEMQRTAESIRRNKARQGRKKA